MRCRGDDRVPLHDRRVLVVEVGLDFQKNILGNVHVVCACRGGECVEPVGVVP